MPELPRHEHHVEALGDEQRRVPMPQRMQRQPTVPPYPAPPDRLSEVVTDVTVVERTAEVFVNTASSGPFHGVASHRSRRSRTMPRASSTSRRPASVSKGARWTLGLCFDRSRPPSQPTNVPCRKRVVSRPRKRVDSASQAVWKRGLRPARASTTKQGKRTIT